MEHDELADLHTYKAPGIALVHPHTQRGWGFLCLNLGEAEMRRYQSEEHYNPSLSHESLDALISEAEQDGLTVQRVER